MRRDSRFLIIVFLQFITVLLHAQIFDLDSLPVSNYQTKNEYEVGGIKVIGTQFRDEQAVLDISGLKVGDKIQIPGPQISTALKKLWKMHLFEDVQIVQGKTVGDIVFLEIMVKEQLYYGSHSFTGVKKKEHDELNSIVRKHLLKGTILTENDRKNVRETIRTYFVGKGYLDTNVDLLEKPDVGKKYAIHLEVAISLGDKVKISNIIFSGNEKVSDRRLRKLMSETNRKRRLFKSSRFVYENFESDKQQVIHYYNTKGLIDARITSDSIWRNQDGDLMIQINLEEGNPYYVRDIIWKGNSVYETIDLSRLLGMQKGDIYNTALLESRLHFDPSGRDVSTLYMDNGHLFFRVEALEAAITGDSVDLEIRILEGPKATIGKVVIRGNDRTNDHVIRRELRTQPGKKFSRSDIIRSQREIISLGYFNPENLQINTPVDPKNGTVDLEYIVEEKPSDQLELSAGWNGPDNGVVGTLGVTFNNFSLRNFWKKDAWNPLPQGDGQRLSLRAQTNGQAYQSYNMSFTEPWLGGKKPMALSVGGFFTRNTDGGNPESPDFAKFTILGGTASLGTRMNWPDDNFISTTAINLQRYDLQNYTNGLFRTDNGTLVSDGTYYNFNISQKIARVTIDNPIFPTKGSSISLSAQFSPPYSWFSKKEISDDPQEQFKFLEYHKWKFDAVWYTTLVGKLVLKTQVKFGFLGRYSKGTSISPFERFQLGGDGFSNNTGGYTGTDVISLRGYETTDLENNLLHGNLAATPLYDKITMELRYPISLNPNATIYGLVFAEGGNAWQNYKSFNPFDLKRSFGAGLRVHLPMFGTLGFDYGIGFDKAGDKTLNNFGKFSIILGFEPE